MSLLAFKRLLVALAVLVAPATMFAAAPPNPAETPAHASLAGQLLVASPAMGDPRFAQTVILMVQHDRNGALGLVINRPAGERPLAEILDALGEPSAGATGSVRIFVGGPVQPEIALMLHSGDYRRPDTIVIDGRFGATATREVLRELAAGTGPAKSLLAFGYAGWRAGQLEGELALNAWYTAPADTRLVFDEDREKLWELAMERRTREL